MLVSDFHKKIKKCNSKLKFLASIDETKPIALYYIDDFKAEHICGTDRNEVPEFIVYDLKGHIIKAGWRRTIDILIFKKYITENKASEVFSSCFSKDCKHKNTKFIQELDPVGRAIKEASGEAIKVRVEGEVVNSIPMKRDDVMDISKMINKNKEKEHAT